MKALFILLQTFFVSVAFGAANINNIDLHVLSFKKSEGLLKFSFMPKTLEPGVFQQDIDHFGQLSGQTFGQRYWIESSYASNSPDAPILYHICGEGDATQGYFLNDNAIEWAKALGAHIVYLEHRYYGQSLPFTDFSTEHLAYLTLDNVLEDLATFQKWISVKKGWKGKWITLGGSYSGTLSALYRQKHPELIVGALAASAPMISGLGSAEGTQSDVSALSSTDPTNYTDGDNDGARQWVYQACTTFGFWEAAGEDISSPYFYPSAWLCQQLFGNAPQADFTKYNQKYDLPFIANSMTAPTNIFFSYGSEDVWTNLGLSTQQNVNSKITIYMIQGAGHHFDLNAPSSSDSDEVIKARQEFLNLAKSWLLKN